MVTDPPGAANVRLPALPPALTDDGPDDNAADTSSTAFASRVRLPAAVATRIVPPEVATVTPSKVLARPDTSVSEPAAKCTPLPFSTPAAVSVSSPDGSTMLPACSIDPALMARCAPAPLSVDTAADPAAVPLESSENCPDVPSVAALPRVAWIADARTAMSPDAMRLVCPLTTSSRAAFSPSVATPEIATLPGPMRICPVPPAAPDATICNWPLPMVTLLSDPEVLTSRTPPASIWALAFLPTLLPALLPTTRRLPASIVSDRTVLLPSEDAPKKSMPSKLRSVSEPVLSSCAASAGVMTSVVSPTCVASTGPTAMRFAPSVTLDASTRASDASVVACVASAVIDAPCSWAAAPITRSPAARTAFVRTLLAATSLLTRSKAPSPLRVSASVAADVAVAARVPVA